MMLLRLAAALCFAAVALGAFGAHALKDTLHSHNMADVWNKAVLYHFIHAIALFSGSLYVMALSNLRWLGAITPFGGLCFLVGWGWLVIAPPR